jgi:hypothetical protein
MTYHVLGDTDREIPIACTLTDDERAMWRDGVGKTIVHGYDTMRELPDGYAFRFPGDEEWAQMLLAFVAHERACCPFFTFGIIFEPDHGPIWLQLSGSTEIKAFAREMMHR